MPGGRHGEEAVERWDDIKLKFRPARWPKIDLDRVIKEDLIRSFNLFDHKGLGVVSLDALKVCTSVLIFGF